MLVEPKEGTDDEKNLLRQEERILRQRKEELLEKYKQVDLQFRRNSNEIANASISDYPRTSLNGYLPFIQNKTLSYEMILNIVARRFHACLLQESQLKPHLADEIGDIELVQTVCKRERLTLYNFLREHATNEQDSEEVLKQQIIREYGGYFLRKGQKPGTGRPIDIYADQSNTGFNTLNNKFKIDFA